MKTGCLGVLFVTRGSADVPIGNYGIDLASADEIEAMVFEAGLGQFVTYEIDQDDEGNPLYVVTTVGADGGEYVSVLGSDGSVLENGYEIEHADDDEDEE